MNKKKSKIKTSPIYDASRLQTETIVDSLRVPFRGLRECCTHEKPLRLPRYFFAPATPKIPGISRIFLCFLA